MPRSAPRAYSRATRRVLDILAAEIRSERKTQKRTVQDIAQRSGISRGTLQRIERGDPKCEIGVVFEVAHLLGLRLLSSDERILVQHQRHLEEKLTLLPKTIRPSKTKDGDDDF